MVQLAAAVYAIASLAAVAVQAGPAANPSAAGTAITSAAIISEVEMARWLATTDAELTFVGARPFNPLDKRAAQSTTVTFCTKLIGPVCGGTCTVYIGGADCLAANGTVCLTATEDVAFCDAARCNGDCGVLSQCGSPLPGGFCATPGTLSILVSAL
ncbi:hypothetical protein BN946_scf184938.g51 [Trametes cinnabarina]|uniref:Uncharacterized protein n=1 Tax=Pycnoporus cinnabarinus TaxID=5643 RepID=A0A060S7D1_PYCCI|nr:hypothetical protein BN946_scf184938.g51 [Trametes cinnabarina]